jgi:hypothetical protein
MKFIKYKKIIFKYKLYLLNILLLIRVIIIIKLNNNIYIYNKYDIYYLKSIIK